MVASTNEGASTRRDRCYYCEIEHGVAVVRRDATRAAVPSVVGVYPLADAPLFQAAIDAGQPFMVADIHTTEVLDEGLRQTGLALGIVSFINVPVIKAGHPVGLFCVTQSRPRAWTPQELDEAADTAERTWAAVERARAEAALAASEERLRALIQNLPGGAVFVVDHDLRYQVAEGEALRAAGMSAEQYVGHTVAEVVAPVLVPIYEVNFQQALAGQSFELEHDQGGASYITRGVPLHGPAGEVTAALTVSYDLTARKVAEQALRVSEARFRAVANLVPDLLWESEPDGSTTWYNGRWLEYTGQTTEQALGWGWTDAIHPADRDASAQRYRQAAAAGRSLRQEHRIRRRDGEYRWFAVDTVPVTDERGEIIKMYGAATDVQELHMLNAVLEERVEYRTRRLADLNSELRALAIASSRELIDPLRRIRSVLGLLERRFARQLDEPARRLLAMLQGEARRAQDLSENFRALAQLEQRDLRWGSVSLAPLLVQVRSDLAPALGARTGRWTVGELPVVGGDSMLLRQAFSELIYHALSVVPPGREAHVDVAAGDSPAPITVEVWPLAPGTANFEAGVVVNARRIVQRHGGSLGVAIHGDRVRFELHLTGRQH